MKNSAPPKISLNALQKVYMIGILGSGMSGLAGILASRGVEVVGSDGGTSHKEVILKKIGIEVFNGVDPSRLNADFDIVVASLAVPATHAELRRAHELGIAVMSYPQAVGLLTQKMRTICICGTHGKTTTTAMIGKTLIENDFNPNVLVGSDLRELNGTNFRASEGSLFVLESCEYKEAFLNYHPNIILLNNLDPDHLDYFKTYENYLNAFIKFCEKLPKDGFIFANIDDEDVHAILQDMRKKGFPPYNIFTFSESKYEVSDFYLKEGTIYHKGTAIGKFDLKIPGAHNRHNALGALSVCSTLGIKAADIIQSLNGYKGAARRFELMGELHVGHRKIEVIDDYGHHPEELKATLQAARERYGADAHICVVFQPHQYSRTRLLFEDFVESLGAATTVLIPNIYEARDSEEDKKAVSAEKLVKALNEAGTKAVHTENTEKTVDYIKEHGAKFDVVITMGAGDVFKIAQKLCS